MNSIGTLRETGLHAALKAWYARPGDQVEVPFAGYVVDLLRGDTVIEIQTHNFSAVKRKLLRLVETNQVRLVYPIALERWIVRLAADGQTPLARRKSPRRGAGIQVFEELVSFPELLDHPNFSLEVLLVREEEVRCPLPHRRGRWGRRDWRICDRRLLEVVGRSLLAGPADCLAYVPAALPQPFTCHDLARALDQPLYLCQKLAYCLRRIGALTPAGRCGRAMTYVCR
ncbi:MAG: hypothetical protein IT318_22485 [Anaerolineales bacterium]|nr:hypothetical protein [Anaerolineales bacterium]